MLVVAGAAVVAVMLAVLWVLRGDDAGDLGLPSEVAVDPRLVAEFRQLAAGLPGLSGTSDQERIRSVLGPPDTFQVSFDTEAEGAPPVRRETWVYLSLFTAFEFDGGALISSLPVAVPSEPALLPRQYEPEAFRREMNRSDVEALLADASVVVRTDVPGELGLELDALAGEQMVAVFDADGLVYVETFALEAGAATTAFLPARSAAAVPEPVHLAARIRTDELRSIPSGVAGFNPVGLVRAVVRTIVNIDRRGDAYRQIESRRDADLKVLVQEQQIWDFKRARGWVDEVRHRQQLQLIDSTRQGIIDRAEREKQITRANYNRAIGTAWVDAARTAILSPAGIDARTQRFVEAVISRKDPLTTSLVYLAETTAANTPETTARIQEIQRRWKQGQQAMRYVVDPASIPIQQRLEAFEKDLADLATGTALVNLTEQEINERLNALRARGAEIERFLNNASRTWIALQTRNLRPDQLRFAQDRRWQELNAAIVEAGLEPTTAGILGGLIRAVEGRVQQAAADKGVPLNSQQLALFTARAAAELMNARIEARRSGKDSAAIDLDALVNTVLQEMAGAEASPATGRTPTPAASPAPGTYVLKGAFDLVGNEQQLGGVDTNTIEITLSERGGEVAGRVEISLDHFPYGAVLAAIEKGIIGSLTEEMEAYQMCTARLVITGPISGNYDATAGSLSGTITLEAKIEDNTGCVTNRPAAFQSDVGGSVAPSSVQWTGTFDRRELVAQIVDPEEGSWRSFRATVVSGPRP